MKTDKKKKFKNLVQSNIAELGFHITVVSSEILPRYAYTIGLTEQLNLELIFAGGVYYLYEDLLKIFREVADILKKVDPKNLSPVFNTTLGSFSLKDVDPSWSQLTMLGVYDYYKIEPKLVMQIVPNPPNQTLDIPDMSKTWHIEQEPVWQWLVRKWSYNVPKQSSVITNLNALLGASITEATRWEEDAWEMFSGAGPDVRKNDTRVVPLATILGIDKTLLPVIDLEIGSGLWRTDGHSEWHTWE